MLLHLGQMTHPSFTLSLPQRMFDCNLFAPFFQEMKENILTPETEKNRKAILSVSCAAVWPGAASGPPLWAACT